MRLIDADELKKKLFSRPETDVFFSSDCVTEEDIDEMPTINYCPNCGAKIIE